MSRKQQWFFIIAVLFVCLMPDFDIAVDWLVLGNEPFANHGGYSHSLAAIAFGPVLWAGVCRLFLPIPWIRLWLIGLIAWVGHVLMDLGNAGRGIMVFWPLDDGRYLFPVRLFMGVSHSDPGNWVHHILTFVTEVAFFAVMWLLAKWWWGRNKSTDEPMVTQTEAG